MALTYAKDIPDLIPAVSANPDLIELKSDVSTIAGDVTELALEVSQLSASVLPMASDDSTTIKENIDNIKISYPTLTFTVKTGVAMTVGQLRAAKIDSLTLVELRLVVGDDFAANAEYEIGTINEKVSTNLNLINGVVTRQSDSKMIGTFNISSKKLYINLSQAVSEGTNLILTFMCITNITE